MIGAISGILGMTLVLSVIGAVIVALVRGRKEGAPPLTFATAVHGYATVVLGVCIILALFGVALILKSASSEIGPRDFSYTVPATGDFRPSGTLSGEQVARNDARNDMAIGVTLLVVGGVLGVLHGFGRIAAARRDAGYARTLSRWFDVVMLAGATVAGLTSTAFLLSEVLRRYILTVENRQPWDIPHPGEPLAFAIVFVPLWMFFGVRVWRALLSGPSPSAESPSLLPAERV